jgi:uncharacterized Zn-binding protein involved in type VI secretion
MKGIIRLGDPTDHGGAVVATTAPHFTVDGIPVARVGDKCSCPKRGHDGCVIVEGDPNYQIGGISVAFDGHHTSCGARLQSTATGYTKD